MHITQPLQQDTIKKNYPLVETLQALSRAEEARTSPVTRASFSKALVRDASVSVSSRASTASTGWEGISSGSAGSASALELGVLVLLLLRLRRRV